MRAWLGFAPFHNVESILPHSSAKINHGAFKKHRCSFRPRKRFLKPVPVIFLCAQRRTENSVANIFSALTGKEKARAMYWQIVTFMIELRRL
ncbi:MAG: hypothetical protein ACI4OL_06060 [Gemmiger sp.]